MARTRRQASAVSEAATSVDAACQPSTKPVQQRGSQSECDGQGIKLLYDELGLGDCIFSEEKGIAACIRRWFQSIWLALNLTVGSVLLTSTERTIYFAILSVTLVLVLFGIINTTLFYTQAYAAWTQRLLHDGWKSTYQHFLGIETPT